MTEPFEVVHDDEAREEESEGQPAIQEPGKLMRIALMLRESQEEARRCPADEAGRERLRVVHERALEGLKSVLSSDLQDELTELALPLDSDVPTNSEILIAQAQLIGWLEGLFQGIQAAIVNQQLMARHQLEAMRQRGLPPGTHPRGPGGPSPAEPSPGQYL